VRKIPYNHPKWRLLIEFLARLSRKATETVATQGLYLQHVQVYSETNYSRTKDEYGEASLSGRAHKKDIERPGFYITKSATHFKEL
jgi:hypothetical protein